jgi:phosphoribosylformylglycinamidine cyclo-ligase
LQEAGGVPEAEMFRAFNMGVGMIVATDDAGAAAVRDRAGQCNISAWSIGSLVKGSGRVQLT